jgi:hypothetical protein
LRVINLQVTAVTEHMVYIEERIRRLERESVGPPANGRDAA